MSDVTWPQPRHTNDDMFCGLCGGPETDYDRLGWSTDLALWLCGRCSEKRRCEEVRRVR